METYDSANPDHSPELRYEMGFTGYPVPPGDNMPFSDYDWTHHPQEAVHGSRPAVYPLQDSMAPQYGSFIGYSNLPPDEMGVVSPTTYIPAGEMSFATPLNHLPYGGHENYYASSFNTISPTSTGSGHSDGSDCQPLQKPKRKRVQTQVQRKAANVRERRRMFHLNEAFDELRKRLPAFNYEKRLSRIETLRLAMTYISFMKNVSDGKDPKDVPLLQVTKRGGLYSDDQDSDE